MVGGGGPKIKDTGCRNGGVFFAVCGKLCEYIHICDFKDRYQLKM